MAVRPSGDGRPMPDAHAPTNTAHHPVSGSVAAMRGSGCHSGMSPRSDLSWTQAVPEPAGNNLTRRHLLSPARGAAIAAFRAWPEGAGRMAVGALALWLLSATVSLAAGGGGQIDDHDFSFEGPFGTYDQAQLQRGLQVYQEVCSGCHGLRYVPLRSLADKGGVGLSAQAVKAFARNYEIFDAEIDDYRAALPTDHFPANDSVNAPDLSLMAKARTGFHGPEGTGLTQLLRGIGGPEYMMSLLIGYTGQEKEEAGSILYQNSAYSGEWIAMAPPLEDGIVEFSDESPNDAKSLAADVTAFLTWAAEPKMMARKRAGLTAVLMLGVLSVLLYLSNQRLWSGIKGRASSKPDRETS